VRAPETRGGKPAPAPPNLPPTIPLFPDLQLLRREELECPDHAESAEGHKCGRPSMRYAPNVEL
jgi:hypothetical protein